MLCFTEVFSTKDQLHEKQNKTKNTARPIHGKTDRHPIEEKHAGLQIRRDDT